MPTTNTLPDFLGLEDPDFQLIDRYRDLLDVEAPALAQAFYNYLLSHPVTADVFRDFSETRLDGLIQKQVEHAKGLLVSRLSPAWRVTMRQVGEMHFRVGIEPSWVAGAYVLYWRQWQPIISAQVPENDRGELRDVLFRLLIGDLMLQLDGYAKASRETDAERLSLFGVLMEVLAVRRGQGSPRPGDLLQQICDALPRKSKMIGMASYWVSDAAGEMLTLEYQAGLPVPELHIQKHSDDPFWKVLNEGQPHIQSREDPLTPEWIKALPHQVKEIGMFPFGAEDLRGVGLIGVHEKGYFQKVGFAYFDAFAHLGELVFLLRNQFLRDPLTALPNRLLFMDLLENAQNQTLRMERLLGVAILDLDGFKQVNDRLGHGAGDQLLQAMVQRLQTQLRAGDTLARLGGDEFALLLPGLERLDDLEGLCERLLTAVRAPLVIEGESVSVSGSLGVTLYPLDDCDASTLMRHADMTLYAAKDAGRDQFQLYNLIFDEAMQTEVDARLLLETSLRENHLCLHYQPIISTSGQVLGVEALLRLQHPKRGLLPPAAFFSALDHARLARPVGCFVLDAALHQAVCWQEAGLSLRVSVNISTRHLLDGRFLEDVQAALVKYPSVNPGQIEIEITESASIHDLAGAQNLLLACQRLGLRVALDDFGTGNASLTCLQQLSADTIKIDQSFVRDVIEDPKDLAIVTAIITASRMLGMEVVAEGVETAEHAELLIKTGCNYMQGYFFSRPLPAEDIPSWIAHFSLAPLPTDSLPPLDILSPILEGHILHIQKALRALRQENPLPARLLEEDAEAHCHLGLWLRGEGEQALGGTPSFARLRIRHKRLYELARAAKALLDAGDTDGALEQGKQLEMENRQLISELLSMMNDNQQSRWPSHV
ncbi:EAL domain-containing protein [Acidithiobacillus thiooxidans]|uniref:Diguanylate cyclase DosC n=1 Tax=Acidithiobacillus thiooxidans TaxID=930 RepID=A0A1C2I839_ACITH|nr:EAL domain-containing protein [Acidithiobacillus thiooxidans]OCX72152.1 diguanylate cyclase [Acidithiobacillus thiooxidans]OCX83936.1 diguanylate cyclase [Acidithiobacillus thiooxidans]